MTFPSSSIAQDADARADERREASELKDVIVSFRWCRGIHFVPICRREDFGALDVLSIQADVEDVGIGSRLSQPDRKRKSKW